MLHIIIGSKLFSVTKHNYSKHSFVQTANFRIRWIKMKAFLEAW